MRLSDTMHSEFLFVTENKTARNSAALFPAQATYAARASAKEASSTSSSFLAKIAVIFFSVYGTLTPTCSTRPNHNRRNRCTPGKTKAKRTSHFALKYSDKYG